MRLWDYRLLKVLPNKMLVSQWRECVAIKRQWEKGTLKHRLVSYVMDYDKRYFASYVSEVMTQMTLRHIKHQKKYYEEFNKFCGFRIYDVDKTLYYLEHNDRYLKQCYYNLQEKYDRGIITQEEWDKIENFIGKEVLK